MPAQPYVRRKAAFTLVELLVVVAIIAILAAMLLPAVNRAMDEAHKSATKNLIHQAELAAQSFFNDYGDYPPSTWEEYFELYEYDYNDSGTFEGSEQGEPDFPDLDTYTVDPRLTNEGIEVFVACVATRNGGPYMEPSGDQLVNTDNDFDEDVGGPDSAPEIAAAGNWYFGGNDLFELADWWGNPLVYFHNRHYAAHDGIYDDGTGNLVFDDPNVDSPQVPGADDELVRYIDFDGANWPVYARAAQGTATQNFPKLNSFQMYSWGIDTMPGRTYRDPVTGREQQLIYPGWTATSGTLPNASAGGWDLDGVVDTDWVPGDGNITNWQE